MLDWILEQQDVWQRLQSCRKPVVLYGMGDGAVKILRVMEQYGIRPAALFASDDFARGNLFMGYKVEKLRDIQARYDDFIIVMAFAVRDLPTVQRIRSLSQQIELVAPDVPVAGINLFTLDFVRQHEQEFARVESMLADEQSKKVLHNIVNFKLSGKLDYLLFDIKHLDSEAHKKATGMGNERILRNLAAVRSAYPHLPIHLRTPLIPGINDDEELIRRIVELARSMDAVHYELLPYHRMGEQKYRFLGREYPYGGPAQVDAGILARLRGVVEEVFPEKD